MLNSQEAALEQMFKEYEETVAQIDKQAREMKEKARLEFREKLDAIQKTYHKELKTIRALEQKTKRRVKESSA